MAILSPQVLALVLWAQSWTAAFSPLGIRVRSPFLKLIRALSQPVVFDRPWGHRDSVFDMPWGHRASVFLLEEKRKRREIGSFKVGEEVEAKVSRLVPFGAFFDVGARVEALLHITEVSADFSPNALEMFTVGNSTMCYIKEVNEEKGRIGLTLRKRKAIEELRLGDEVEGKVLRVNQFGGFVDIGANKDALLHVSEITDEFIEDASERLQVGDTVQCHVLEIDLDKQRVGITCKYHLFIEPRELPCTGAVIFLHGYGDNPYSWEREFRPAIDSNPTWKWVFLRAPKVPQTHRYGKRIPAWGDYYDDECTHVGSNDYNNDYLVSDETIKVVHRTIEEIQHDNDIAPHRIVVSGYSMGATAAAACALTYRTRLAGLAILNGWLVPIARKALKKQSAYGLRVLVSHGTDDEAVGFDCGKEAVQLLQAAGATVAFGIQKGMDHEVSANTKGKKLAMKFFEEVLTDSEAPLK